MDLKAVEPGNLSSRAYAALRDALIAGRFDPGERLVMQDLAEQFGTSVTPVREGCLRLVSEQGLEVRSGRFIVVPELRLPRYLEIRAIRIALEGLAAELAVQHARPADIERLAAIQQQFESLAAAGDAAGANTLNRDFHFGVYALSGMDMLVRQIETMWVSMGPILKVYHEKAITGYADADEHVRLIEALQRRDGAGARRALENDIVRGGEGILRYLSTLGGRSPPS